MFRFPPQLHSQLALDLGLGILGLPGKEPQADSDACASRMISDTPVAAAAAILRPDQEPQGESSGAGAFKAHRISETAAAAAEDLLWPDDDELNEMMEDSFDF